MKNNVVAVYIRVSTDLQTEYSPDAQLKAIKEYARKNDLEIDSNYIFKDEGISGRKAEKRPEFMRMIAIAKTKPQSPFSKILVHKFDRFARNREDSVVYKSLLKKECNVDVVSITEDFGDDKFSVILEAMLEAMAEYYSLNLSDEVYKGMMEKASRGEWQSKAPYGYIMKDGMLVIDEDEAKVVKMIFSNFMDGMGLLNIAKKLNSMKIRTKKNNMFEVRIVEYILRNPIYCGKVRWCPNSKNSWNFSFREKNSILKEGNYPTIISVEDFDKVQKIIDENKLKHKYIKSQTKQHWIRKLVKCSNCGSTLTTSNNGLQCISYSHGKCNESHYISIKTIESAILNQIRQDFDNPVNLHIIRTQKDNSELERDLLNKQIKDSKDKLERCKNLYLEGIDTIEEYKDNKEKILKELEKLKAQLKNIPDDTSGENNRFDIKVKNIYELLTNENVNMDVKYTAIHSIIDKIVYNKHEETLEIYYKN